MKKVTTTAILLAVTIMMVSAMLPDNEHIFQEITNGDKENYYPNLMMRFELGDTTLTLNNYHYLYYGFAHQSDYKPHAINPEMDKFLLLASGIDPDAPNAETLRRIISVGQDALIYDPFNLKVWNMLAFAYGALGAEEQERAAYDRVEKIVATIKATGNGVEERSPQHILMFDHAVDIMAIEGLNHTKAMVVSRTVEYIPLIAPLNTNEKKVRGFYFDFSRIYWNKPDSVTFKRDRTWQFNNTKPKEYK
ncbi:MAG: DUF4919 domain-containing protein [Rikenellaceae bacterium]